MTFNICIPICTVCVCKKKKKKNMLMLWYIGSLNFSVDLLYPFCVLILSTQVDFPSVIVKKLLIISQTPHLQDCVGELKSVDDDVFVSDVYSAIGCNISNLPALQSGLKKASVDFRAPTLFLSECVLTYINPSRYQCCTYILFPTSP